MNKLRVAIIHDWLVTWRGGEKCLEQFTGLFQECDVYTLFLDQRIKEKYLENITVRTGLLGRLPFVHRYYRLLLLLFPLDIWFISKALLRVHKEKPYDLVLSISHCAVKNITPPENIPHVSYCLTPMRYIWDQYERYLEGKWYEPFFRPFRLLLQSWDIGNSQKVTRFIAISEFISNRIDICYGLDSVVVYPPVETNVKESSSLSQESGDTALSFLMVNALVPYKNTKLIVESFADLPYTLTIVGTGPEEVNLKRIATSNVTFMGRVEDDILSGLYQSCAALIYAAEEDFGIVPVEAQAYGRPVICFGKGGCLETVILEGDSKTGVSFSELEVHSVKDAVCTFLNGYESGEFKSEVCKKNASRFSVETFIRNISGELSSVGKGTLHA
jgi:glycosyltransferase involved in cell wall biosynthesis